MLNPFRWPFRTQCIAGFAVCLALLAYAYFVQFQLGIEPCPLCIFQRLAFIGMGIVFLAGAIHGPRATGRRVYGLLVLLAATVGAGIAAYHVWVQQQPPDPMAGCAPGWNYWVENYSIKYAWSKTVQQAFTGHADCAQVNWTLLGMSMPVWTFVCYALIGAGALWAGFRRRD
ncbi:MAG TPA: disulfide bond formation protein B [Rudaea sp.]|jgi:disulfide bond formation protein DsbB|nr:disulfide bond formation protein B [Rudaea sp.]